MHEAPPQIAPKLQQTSERDRRHPCPGLEVGSQDQLAYAAEAEDGAEGDIGPEDGVVAVGCRFDGALGRDVGAGLVGGHCATSSAHRVERIEVEAILTDEGSRALFDRDPCRWSRLDLVGTGQVCSLGCTLTVPRKLADPRDLEGL